MNLHKDITRRKMIFAVIVAGLLLVAACCIVGRQRGMIGDDWQPTAVVDPALNSDPMISVSDVFHGASVDGDDAQQTTAPAPQSTMTSHSDVVPHSPVVVLPPDYEPESAGRTECSGRFTVTSESANVRTDANGDAQLVRQIFAGESYEVIAQKCSSTGILWLEIKLGDTTGYVAGSYVEYDGPIIGGKAYLTFDDGPSANTWRILETLDRYNVKATFFVIHHGGQDDAYRAIVERGHTIALHSYSHSYSKIYTSAQAYFDDLKQLDKQVYDLTGVHSSIIRFPGGTSNAVSAKYCKGVMTEIAARAQRDGYFYFDWNVDSGDADDVTVPADTILNNIKRNIGSHRQAVILMHDAKAKTTTADALPYIIEYLQSRGYEILPLTEDTPPVHHKPSN